MFNLVKKIVAGPKRTVTFEGLELDLTYISDRIIAMAFPACNIIEKTYRNNINDVVQYLKSKHGDNYLIINVSNRLYDYDKFENKVKDYEWNDHQAPPLTTLILIGYQIYYFLKSNPEGVVAIHCNHGKGRTGTTIIAYMLLVGYMRDVQQCVKLYNEKRFSEGGYGVDQPCQLRYLKFVSILKRRSQIEQKIPFYRLKMISQQGLSQKHTIKVTRTRDQKVIMNDVPFDKELDLTECSNFLFSDCLFEIYQQKFFKEKVKIARINYNLFFVDNSLELTFSSDSIKLQKSGNKKFTVSFSFQFFCLCHLSTYQGTKCKCSTYRIAEEMFWNQMRNVLKECRNIKQQQAKGLIDWQNNLQTTNLNEQKVRKPSLNNSLKMHQVKRRKKSANSQVRAYRQQKIYAKMLNFRKNLASTVQVQSQHTQEQFKRYFSQNQNNLQNFQFDKTVEHNSDLKHINQEIDIKASHS